MTNFYTLILTRSSHTISRETALAIRSALDERRETVEVELTLFRDQRRLTVLNTAHVIGIAEDPSNGGPLVVEGEKVRVLRR
jgi:hypothetical protein